jgi:hemolysin D
MATSIPARLRLVSGPSKADAIFGGRPNEELEFLPAALEIVETPPPPLPRVMALTVTGLLLATIGWASLSQVDVVSTAGGQIVPAGGGKVIQPLETGTVKAIHVQDGQRVRKGEVLIEIDPVESRSDRDRLKGELAAARLDVARLRAVALGQVFTAPSGSDPAAAAIARRQAEAEITENAAKLASLDHQILQHKSELASARAEEQKLQALLPLSAQRTQAFATLDKQGFGSPLRMLEAQEKETDTEHSLEVQRKKAPGLEAGISATERQRAQAAAEAAKTSLAALSEAEVKAGSLANELSKAQERLGDRTLTAPVDGAVQELSIHTIGGVVEPGQTLLRVAPSGASVEIEAKLENKDIGFVRPGMPAQIKVETFPFTRYGLVHAKVLTVSSDALTEPPAAPKNPDVGAPAAKTDQGTHYMVRLALLTDRIEVDGHHVRLTPGMAVTAEILTAKRRVISYVLSPLSKAMHEAGRER